MFHSGGVKDASAWEKRFDRFIKPFLDVWRSKKRRHWAPIYLRGLLLPGERKSIEPVASRVAPGHEQELGHFVSESPWETEPIEQLLWDKADTMLGGQDAFLIIDDTALPKKGDESVGVAHQYCGALGKQANCQSLVSLTLAKGDVPVPVALRLYRPEAWAMDAGRHPVGDGDAVRGDHELLGAPPLLHISAEARLRLGWNSPRFDIL